MLFLWIEWISWFVHLGWPDFALNPQLIVMSSRVRYFFHHLGKHATYWLKLSCRRKVMRIDWTFNNGVGSEPWLLGIFMFQGRHIYPSCFISVCQRVNVSQCWGGGGGCSIGWWSVSSDIQLFIDVFDKHISYDYYIEYSLSKVFLV